MRVGHDLDGVHHGMARVEWGERASNPTFLAGCERNAVAVSMGAGVGGVSGWNAECNDLDAGFDIVSSVGGACIRCSPWDT